MPKIKSCLSEQLRHYVNEFGADILSPNGKILYCQNCDKVLNPNKNIKKFQVRQHLETAAHAKNLERAKNKKQTFIDLEKESSTNISIFLLELTIALISADIPFSKLANLLFKVFLEKYTNHTIPNQTTFKRTYLPLSHDRVMAKIREKFSG
jgi:hypothetical protein